MMKLCKDCKWSKMDGRYSKCSSPRIMIGSKVSARVGYESAKKEPVFGGWCDIQREDWWPFHYIFRTCGAVGRYWEARRT